jgi:transcriptional regulator with XRE-family HTH domain
MIQPHQSASTLQQVRKARRISQLDLSLELGVSQRHISFVESGRAKPSRELLLAWLQTLDAPLLVRNEVMLQAGYAPVYGAAPLEDGSLAQANEALVRLLQAHDPMPALVIDAEWNLLRLNRGGEWLLSTLGGTLPPGASINLLDLLVHPQGLTQRITNLPEVAPGFLARLRQEAATCPEIAAKVEALATLLQAQFGVQGLHPSAASTIAPVLTTRYATPYGELAFFSMFTTFGTPQDITLASLRVEHLFAADGATQTVLETQVPR